MISYSKQVVMKQRKIKKILNNRFVFSNGFTLLELMIVLAIAGVIAAIAGPSFQSVIVSSSIDTHRDALAAGIKKARAEALYRNSTAVICASTDQNSCSGGSDWDKGWIIFSDANTNASYDAGTDTLVDVFYPNNKIRVGVDDSSSGTITFNQNGLLQPAGALMIGLCDKDTSSTIPGKPVEINTTGGIRFQGDPGC